MKYTLQIRLNSDRAIDRVIMDVLADAENSAETARELMYSAIVGADSHDIAQVNNNEVLQAIAVLSRKIDNLPRVTSNPADESSIPLRSDELLDAADEAALELSQQFIVGLKKCARPGMHLDD